MDQVPGRSKRKLASDRGASLVESLLAAAILIAGIVSIAQLFTVATKSNLSARQSTVATILAQQKLEQLRALAWGFDAAGATVSDLVTDTSAAPDAGGGSGLQTSPPTALRQNTTGFVDHLDANGMMLGSSEQAPPAAVYTRRWSIAPASANPDGLVIEVLVTAAGRVHASDSGLGRLPGEARLVTVKVRKAP